MVMARTITETPENESKLDLQPATVAHTPEEKGAMV
jgi:hypothetical protein